MLLNQGGQGVCEQVKKYKFLLHISHNALFWCFTEYVGSQTAEVKTAELAFQGVASLRSIHWMT